MYKMTESVELYTLNGVPDGEIEEYHEIDRETRESVVINTLGEPINSVEFFTSNDTKGSLKKSEKKKKHKKKDKHSYLMDIIATEIANFSVPLRENVIERADESIKHSQLYLFKYTGNKRFFHRIVPCCDYERGFPKSRPDINPVFPRILENTSTLEIPLIPVEYNSPELFKDVLNDTTQGILNTPKKFLDIEIRNLKFLYHHHYSLENLLCLKLVEYFKEYEDLTKFLKDLAREIKIGRETKNNIKKDFLKVSPKKKEEIRFDDTLRKYTYKLLELKTRNIETLKLHKEVIHKLISIWSDIEMIREKSGSRETPYNLIIKKTNVNKTDFEKEWTETFETEFMDTLDKLEYDYVSKYIEYKEIKSKSLDSSKKKISKPKLNIDEDKVRLDVEETVHKTVMREKLQLGLERLDNIETILKKNNYYFEIYVDNVFVCESERYFCNINLFEIPINESFSIEILNYDILTVTLVENDTKLGHVDIDLTTIKNSVDLQNLVFDFKAIVEPSDEHVGNGSSIKEIAAVNKIRLKCSNIFKGKLTTACAVNLKLSWTNNVKENFSDMIKSSAEIGHKLKRLMHGIDKPNATDLTDLISKIYEKDVSNYENIRKTVTEISKQEEKVDEKFPIDENSAEFVRFKLLHLRNTEGFTNIENKVVPIHGSQISTEHLNFLQKSDEKEFDIEYLREKESYMDPIELQRFIAAKYIQKLNKKMIMNLNEHLMVKTQKDVIREYRDFSLRSLFARTNMDNSMLISNCTKQELLMESLNKEQEIQITVLRAFNLMDRSTGLLEEGENEDTMEIADNVPGYKVHPLRPFVRVSYHNASEQTVIGIGCHPTWNHTLRITTKRAVLALSDGKLRFTDVYVEYQGKDKIITVCEIKCCEPLFANELHPLSSLHINIYDECKENISEGSDDQSATVHYRYINKWLGAAHIPLFPVLSLGSLRGTFKISSPPLVFGYETLQNKESTSIIPEITQLMRKDVSYITLHITSSLSHLGGFQAYNQPLPSTIEDDYIIKHLNNFVSDYLNNFPERNISLTFIDSGGRNRSVTQFLQPIPLPSREYFPKNPKSCGSAMSKSSGFSRSSSSSGRKRDVDLEANEEKDSVCSWKGDSLGRTLNACLRYVALIPTYDVTDTHAVTLMGLELLKVLYGTPLDHAVLLASYFLYLGIRCYIAIGLGLPRGRSSYVLIQYDLNSRRVVTSDQPVRKSGFLSKPEGYLWYVCDAVSGDRHELRDVGCPMKTVDYVFDNENIWVNVQSSQDCESVVFDFTKSSDWQPVFAPSMFVVKQPVVTDASIYSAPRDVERLRLALETKIKAKVQKWRALKKTVWNRYCSVLLREALLNWEYWAFNPNENKPGFSQKLKQLMVTYKVFGFPLNLPFVSTKSLVSGVKSTGVHASDEPRVEFSLALEVFPYPNNVLSVWLFFVSITRI